MEFGVMFPYKEYRRKISHAWTGGRKTTKSAFRDYSSHYKTLLNELPSTLRDAMAQLASFNPEVFYVTLTEKC